MEYATKTDVREIMKELIQTDMRPLMYEVSEDVSHRVVLAAFSDLAKFVAVGFEEVAAQFSGIIDRIDSIENQLADLNQAARHTAIIVREHSADITELKTQSKM